MSTPTREEPASAGMAQPAAQDAAGAATAAASVVAQAPPPVMAPSNLVLLGGEDAPACADGVCW